MNKAHGFNKKVALLMKVQHIVREISLLFQIQSAHCDEYMLLEGVTHRCT